MRRVSSVTSCPSVSRLDRDLPCSAVDSRVRICRLTTHLADELWPIPIHLTPAAQHPQLLPYAPVLQRATDELQVGVDPDAALVFRGPGYGALLDPPDGSQPISAVRRGARAAGLTTAQVREALDALASAGLLAERGTTPYADSLSGADGQAHRCRTCGPPACSAACRQRAAALVRLRRRAADLVSYPGSWRLGFSVGGTAFSPRRQPSTTVSPLSHWSKPEGVRWISPIVACDQPEPRSSDH